MSHLQLINSMYHLRCLVFTENKAVGENGYKHRVLSYTCHESFTGLTLSIS